MCISTLGGTAEPVRGQAPLATITGRNTIARLLFTEVLHLALLSDNRPAAQVQALQLIGPLITVTPKIAVIVLDVQLPADRGIYV